MGSATPSTVPARCSRSTWRRNGWGESRAAASTSTNGMTWALTPLSEEQQEIQRMARDFAIAEIAPHSAVWDRDAYFDPGIVTKMGELGFLGMLLPEEYGGLALDTLTYLVALEEIAVVDASIAVTMSVHNSLPTQMILRWGTDA